MAELAYFDVEQEEEAFGDEEACRPKEGKTSEEDRADMEVARHEDTEQEAGSADEEEIAHDGRSVDAVVRLRDER